MDFRYLFIRKKISRHWQGTRSGDSALYFSEGVSPENPGENGDTGLLSGIFCRRFLPGNKNGGFYSAKYRVFNQYA